MRKLLIAISFFTRIPINVKDVSEEEFFSSMLLMPVVGFFIGAVLSALAYGLSFTGNAMLGAVMLILCYLAMTGGLHFDGVADTVDAIFSARDHEKMMQIMKDSRLGAFGAIGLIVIFMTAFAAYASVLPYNRPMVFLMMPVIGRYMAIQSGSLSPAAPDGGGLGKAFIAVNKKSLALLYCLGIAVLSFFALGIVGVVGFLLTALINLLMMWVLIRKIGGFTGDTIGLTIEVTQVVYVTVMAYLLPHAELFLRLIP
ncbi:MAG: adenosylcobinamide-GDP ribazoletransferase [Eubacteriaceae bacterium]|nr:adenosylcobinamide-GDP ribazoletransferase [Eubacteriaceae bacterium]